MDQFVMRGDRLWEVLDIFHKLCVALNPHDQYENDNHLRLSGFIPEKVREALRKIGLTASDFQRFYLAGLRDDYPLWKTVEILRNFLYLNHNALADCQLVAEQITSAGKSLDDIPDFLPGREPDIECAVRVFFRAYASGRITAEMLKGERSVG